MICAFFSADQDKNFSLFPAIPVISSVMQRLNVLFLVGVLLCGELSCIFWGKYPSFFNSRVMTRRWDLPEDE